MRRPHSTRRLPTPLRSSADAATRTHLHREPSDAAHDARRRPDPVSRCCANGSRRMCRGDPFTLAPASSDASFRRYFRATFARSRRLIAMDAPPPQEDCRPFVDVARRLRDAGVNAPRSARRRISSAASCCCPTSASRTYLSALDATSAQRRCIATRSPRWSGCSRGRRVDGSEAVRPRDPAARARSLSRLVRGEALRRRRGRDAQNARCGSDGCEVLLANTLAQPKVFVHRDYHSRNLMVCEDARGMHNPGVLDFQDALDGPITYDLVSLLKDAYIRVGRGVRARPGRALLGCGAAREVAGRSRLRRRSIATSNGWASSGS